MQGKERPWMTGVKIGTGLNIYGHYLVSGPIQIE
jgi:hypothetical protein